MDILAFSEEDNFIEGVFLPFDALVQIFGFLTFVDLSRTARVCKYFKHISDSDVVWQDAIKTWAKPNLELTRASQHSDWRVWGTDELRQAWKLKKTPVCEWKRLFRRWNTFLGDESFSIECARSFPQGGPTVNCLHFWDKYVVAGGWKDIKIWDVVTGLPQQTLRGHQGHVLALHGDENTIVSGGEDCTIRLWDPTTGECLRIIEVGMPVFAVHLFKETLYVGGLDGCLHKWNISTGRVLENLAVDSFSVTAIDVTPKCVVTAGENVQVWSATMGKCLRQIYPEEKPAVLGNLRTRRTRWTQPTLEKCQGVKVVGQDYVVIAFAGLTVWNIYTGKLVRRLTHARVSSFDVVNEKYVVASELDCKRVGKFAHEVSSVAIYDVKTGVLCRRLAAGIFGEISDVKVVQDLVVTASQDGIIKIWHAVDTSLIKMRLSYSDACKLLWLTPAFSDCRTRSDKRNEQ